MILVSIVLSVFAACDENEMYKEELYEKMINIVSDDEKVFVVEYDLNEEDAIGYISVNCGGTNRIDRDVMVELEPDLTLLPEYNRLNYDTATLKYAKEMPLSHYKIPTMSTIIKKEAVETYGLVEVRVKPEGLSPDSLYMIPLRIKNVSDYVINPDKDNVLYNVQIKNDYARQMKTTYYKMRGTKVENNGMSVPTSADKVFYPISKNKVRMLAGILAFKDKMATLDEIDKGGVIITINADNTLTLTAAGSLQLEMVGDPQDNRYEVEAGVQVFYLSYKYYWPSSNTWITMTEKCTRQK